MSSLPEDDPMRVHRPCPFVSCRHHLHADVDDRTGVVTIIEGDIAHTCALDVVDAHPDGVSREELADVLRVSPERTRFFERRVERVLRENPTLERWRGHESVSGADTARGGDL